MNKRIASHIQYCWIVYVIVAVSVIAIWNIVFAAFAQPMLNEQVSLIFYSEGFDSSELTADLNRKINEITTQSIKKVTTEQVSAGKAVLFQRIGTDMLTSDIIVIEKSLLEQNDDESRYTIKPDEVFYEIDTEKLADIDVEYLTVNGKAYGIYLNDQSDGIKNNFEMFYSGKDEFVLFFSRESVNIDRMNELGNEGDTAAIDVVKYLLEKK